ncbi:hypothetical protein M406DRAFT_101045, partial [Cryphonectria parasitica EP155]
TSSFHGISDFGGILYAHTSNFCRSACRFTAAILCVATVTQYVLITLLPWWRLGLEIGISTILFELLR